MNARVYAMPAGARCNGVRSGRLGNGLCNDGTQFDHTQLSSRPNALNTAYTRLWLSRRSHRGGHSRLTGGMPMSSPELSTTADV